MKSQASMPLHEKPDQPGSSRARALPVEDKLVELLAHARDMLLMLCELLPGFPQLLACCFKVLPERRQFLLDLEEALEILGGLHAPANVPDVHAKPLDVALDVPHVPARLSRLFPVELQDLLAEPELLSVLAWLHACLAGQAWQACLTGQAGQACMCGGLVASMFIYNFKIPVASKVFI